MGHVHSDYLPMNVRTKLPHVLLSLLFAANMQQICAARVSTVADAATSASAIAEKKAAPLMQEAAKASDKLRERGSFFRMFRPEIPDPLAAAKVDAIEFDSAITSPRTLTYKSRLSRVSRWIGPLTLGLLNYFPFETMNAAVAGRINNLMAEEKISVEEMTARAFRESLAEGKRFRVDSPAGAVMKIEVTRYALDPVPTSLGRMKPTLSVTGRLYSPKGRLLWIGKGFSTIAEPTIKGATVEQYEDDPEALRRDFSESARIAARRLAAQANALPRAKVTIVPPER